ncbi:MAG TPA: TIGR03085 family metal-binding protein [Ilumatobacteraceae bacterium]|nr:TIGR03085 family metal-binding protein [Ilumatobacteraceae bacterium]
MTTGTYPAQQERAALCDLFSEVGPDAPTLCGDWTTRDLAAHLVVRERRPDAAVGIVISKAAGYTDKVQAGAAAAEWDDLIDTVRSGPPVWSPTRIAAIDKVANTVEFFVHHEDVRRAGGVWDPRELEVDLTDTLASMMSKMAKRMVRSSTIGIVLEPTDGHPSVVAKKAEPSVTVSGGIGELVMFVFGRQAHSQVALSGDETSIETVQHASFGI